MAYRARVALLFPCFSLVLGCSTPAASGDAGTDAATTDGGGADAGPPLDASSGADAGLDAGADAGPPDPCGGGACDPCDDALAIDDTDATSAAHAMGVCSGLVSAAWTMPDGSAPSASSFALGHGLLGGFGALTPREGTRMVAISTGTARGPTDPGFQSPVGLDKGYASTAPAGFPRDTAACGVPTSTSSFDGISLDLTLDVPAGANGFRFLVKYHSSEFPTYVCSAYDDQAVVLVSPAPSGAVSGDVTIDATGTPLSVNSSFVDVCTCAGGPPCSPGGRTYACSLGAGELSGTGFDPSTSAATPWLEVRVPATAGSRVTVRIALWDSGDGLLDSTALVDGFRWITDAPASAGTRVLP